MKTISDLKIKIFSDCAEIDGLLEMASKPYIKGFTTNPTLMRKAGIDNYEDFAHQVLDVIKDRPVSFEVVSDDFSEMQRQALVIAGWAQNVFIKIPVSNTKGNPSYDLIHKLASSGVNVNVTAIMTMEQVKNVSAALENASPSIISVFAGRIADSGRDPMPFMAEAVKLISNYSKQELLWASPRELLNIFQANEVGCQIITVSHDILKKMDLVGKSLEEFSLDTVKMFWNDAVNAGLTI